MVNWQIELKKYLAKKFKEIIGEDIPLENIHAIEIETELILSGLTISELGHIYAFAIMKEDFEHAKGLADELTERGYEIKIETDETKRIGAINVYSLSDNKLEYSVPMKLYPDGMIVDFEKQGEF